MRISIEKISELVTREVIKELRARGIDVDGGPETDQNTAPVRYAEPDLSGYKTPVLSEYNIPRPDSGITEIRVPAGTILTPVARDKIRQRKIRIIYKP